MKVLFIGGTGIISSACTDLLVKRGIELYHINRGRSNDIRPVPAEVKTIIADVRDVEKASRALLDYEFDVVVDWISFVPEHLQTNLELLKNKVNQYVFISSASAYQTPPQSLPVTEKTPLDNPFWEYSRNKIECEKYIASECIQRGLKYTIVRPSHTYDKTVIPILGDYTAVSRMLEGKPVVVQGDGTSIWTLTHHRDFAVGLVGLLGNKKAMNEVFHITSDEWLSWNQIYNFIAKAFGVEAKLVHIPSNIIASYNNEIGASLLGDKAHSMIFDNSKIRYAVPEFKCVIPYELGVREVANWYLAKKDRQVADSELNKIFDAMILDFSAITGS
jgi:nucleoside-diphosphate-sugar epimerase